VDETRACLPWQASANWAGRPPSAWSGRLIRRRSLAGLLPQVRVDHLERDRANLPRTWHQMIDLT
jgi:hypothetical protein